MRCKTIITKPQSTTEAQITTPKISNIMTRINVQLSIMINTKSLSSSTKSHGWINGSRNKIYLFLVYKKHFLALMINITVE